MLRLVLLCSCDIYVAVLQISLYCINIPYLSPHCFQRFCHMQALGITKKARSVSWPDVVKCDYIVFLFSSVLFCLSCECVFCAFHCGYFVFGYCRRQLRSTAADIAMCLSWCGWVSGWTVAEPMMKSLYHRHICAESAIKPQPTLLSPIFIHADAVVWWRHV